MNTFVRGCSSILSRGIRSYATPTAKYVELYESNFEEKPYPIKLLGGTHTSFAKLMYQFSKTVDNKSYADQFEILRSIIANEGPFWGEADFTQDKSYDKLTPGFRFVLAWMRSEKMLDSLDAVEASFLEFVDADANQIRATISVAWNPNENKAEIDRIKKEAASLYSKQTGETQTPVFNIISKPELKGGYTFEIGSLYINNSDAAKLVAQAAAAKGSEMDWTAMPAAPAVRVPGVSEELYSLLGAEVDVLQSADNTEKKYGA
eukprot:NODE_1336_length_957_cov_616.462555_g1030_i0.p1 GENE.NODE_1336_length_957_cov_616.462555_g1030_i0~~NODE_1336_length_957_cov_616.462555_g1030_i0.p1  ORF type:complete len:262 (-),score=61.24 NODE_1336_length_957_cov_616.462555_g1030_i0:107-892(-)